jgi:hypothetical protein
MVDGLGCRLGHTKEMTNLTAATNKCYVHFAEPTELRRYGFLEGYNYYLLSRHSLGALVIGFYKQLKNMRTSPCPGSIESFHSM